MKSGLVGIILTIFMLRFIIFFVLNKLEFFIKKIDLFVIIFDKDIMAKSNDHVLDWQIQARLSRTRTHISRQAKIPIFKFKFCFKAF